MHPYPYDDLIRIHHAWRTRGHSRSGNSANCSAGSVHGGAPSPTCTTVGAVAPR